MGSVYIYDANAEDFSTIGICGELTPVSCTFHEVANGISELTLEHPTDELNRYTCLMENRILKADVPVRTTPEIAAGQYVTVIETYTVKTGTATKAQRYIYNKADPSKKGAKKLKLVPEGGEVQIVAKYSDSGWRWKCKYTWQEKKKKKTVSKTVTGYISSDTTNVLEYKQQVIVDDSSTGIEQVAPSWRIEEQLFRITSVEKTESTVHVQAQHITYDAMYDLTTYDEDEGKTLQQAADGVLAGCIEELPFTFQTNIAGEKQGFHFADKDPVTALLDPETGLVPRWNGELIRDNYSFTVLDHAGVNRGMMFTYGKNVKGISMSLDMSDVATAVRPVGETDEGKPVYLEHSFLWDGENTTQLADTDGVVYGRYHSLVEGELVCSLPHARIFSLKGEECKVNKKDGPNIATVRARLLDQAVAMLAGGAEEPSVSVQVDMQLLGYTQQWAVYRDLEKLFLFDTVRVFHPRMVIDIETVVTEMEWDCLNDMPVSIGMGDVHDLTPSVAGWQVSGLNGAKLTAGTVSSAQLQDGAVTALKVGAAAIGSAAIQDAAIGAAKIEDASITTAKIASAAIEALKVDDFIYASKGYFDRLCVMAENGVYYKFSVNALGQVTAVAYDNITEAEKTAGVTNDGKPIVETDLDATDLNTLNLKDTNALYEAIRAECTDVDTFFARDAVIQKLRVASIGSLDNGSNIKMDYTGVYIATPKFEVDIGDEGSEDLVLKYDGMYVRAIAAGSIEGLPAARRYLGEAAIAAESLGDTAEILRNRQLDKDVTVSISDTTVNGPIVLAGITGTGKLTIVGAGLATPTEVLGGVRVESCFARIEFKYMPAQYTIVDSPFVTFTDCNGGSSGTQTVTVTDQVIQAHTTASWFTPAYGWTASRTTLYHGLRDNGRRYAALAWFDLSGIPAGATFTAAKVRFRRSGSIAGNLRMYGYTTSCTGPGEAFAFSQLTATGHSGAGSLNNWTEIPETGVDDPATTAFVGILRAGGGYGLYYGGDSTLYAAEFSGSAGAYPPELVISYQYTASGSSFQVTYVDNGLADYLRGIGAIS